ncbi:ATP-binding protein [Actinoplanes solisilvae]|uniref:ATP-binding protein n=1 Tax=Actinoplanes solisilvae TaxID=2486853 RepID=UPI001F0C33C4|nr:LuxR family transcriptional regulator [Actinoplanes solisilvae]
MELLGRHTEREAVKQLLVRAQSGHSAALVVRGEAGIGKTALLEHARDIASGSGFRMATSVGVESETNFAFAGLHQLAEPLLDRAGALPEPQQAALGVAFGRQAGMAPDCFLVGLATLSLLAEVAEERPLLCLVDDAQWLDQASAQVLAFVARRVAAERLALMFALRDPTESDIRVFDGLPGLRLDGLGEADARALLTGAVPAPLDDGVRERIVAEARGNPLALLELPRSAQPGRLAGGFELPDALSVPRRVEEIFQRRSGSLPAESQLQLLIAAAEPTGDVTLLWRAGEKLGIAKEAALPAEAAGLLEIGTRVRFRHPLVRSAVYRAASPPDRRRAHGALAAAIDPLVDPDRQVWHLAQAVLGPDEEVAAGLERSAGRARARGGSAAAAAFLQQAAELTPEPADRARRALEAADAKQEAGAPEAALELLAVAAAGPLDARQRGRLQLVRARIAFYLTRGSDVPGMLLDAARTLGPLDAALARETYLDAFDTAIITGEVGHERGVREVAESAKDAPAPPGPPRPADMLLDALVTAFLHGYEAGVPELRRAVQAFRDQPAEEVAGNHRWLWLASRIALALFDDDSVLALADRNVRLAREAGALGVLPPALLFQSVVLVFAGEVEHAGELAAEEVGITQATGGVPLLHAQLVLAAWRGNEAEATRLHAASVEQATARGEGTAVTMAQYALTVLHNGLGNYPAALDAARSAARTDETLYSNLNLPELIEAASRAGEPQRAATAVELLSERARASRSPWALGLAARSQALISTGPGAEKHYREAIEWLQACRMAGHLARTHLVYGEWLRREGRRLDAREQLRTAHELLSNMGLEGFAARAARELRATGEYPRKRTAATADALTAHELHVARLVATGATSQEVGAQLFLSPRTIEAHLRNIFRKLGITSRRQLRELNLPGMPGA